MTAILRACALTLLFVGLFGIPQANATQETWAQKVANAHGMKEFTKIKSITYTFNVQFGKRKMKRTWRWEPQTGRVSFRKDAKQPWLTYTRNDKTLKGSKKLKKIDHGFINDRYWLVFPLHLIWDKTAKLTVKPIKKPLVWGKHTIKATQEIWVQYPKQGGYTPGDLYKLYVDKDGVARAWSFHRGGQAKPNRRTTWEQYKKFGPLNISLLRRGIKPGFKIWFTDVAVTQ